MYDDSVTPFYQSGDYIHTDNNRGWIVQYLGFGAYDVVTDENQLINVHELDIEFRDNSKSINAEEAKELAENIIGEKQAERWLAEESESEALYWDSVIRPEHRKGI